MSTPSSRLSNYQSYSFYHVLVMCDSTKTADDLITETSADVWMHATPQTEAPRSEAAVSLGAYAPKLTAAGGKYVVLINGSTDAAYVITAAQWSSSTAADAVPGDRATSIAVEGSVSISEPKGIAFLDQIVKCSIALGVDSSQVVYALKTFFVGYTTSDSGEPGFSSITDVPPVIFLAVDVTGNFDEAGGTYEMLFTGAGHGTTRLPQYSKMVNSITLKAGDSLEETLTKLQDNVNESYDKYFSCIFDQVSAINNATAKQLSRSMRKVKYKIVVGDPYKLANGGAKYKVTDQASAYKTDPECGGPAIVNLPQHSSLETAISNIMAMCPEVRKEMTIGDASGIKYEYKIHTTIVSTPGTGDDAGLIDYTVYYRVDRFATPKTLATSPVFETLGADDPKSLPEYAAIRNNILEFDYLYTGKNTDVLEFDIKLNAGLAYLQIATMVNAFKSGTERVGTSLTQAASDDLRSFNVRLNSPQPLQVPILFGSQIRVPTGNYSSDSSSYIQTLYTLTKHASLEVSEATMRIFGNDLLLGSTNRTTSPTYVMSSGDAIRVAAEKPSDADFQCWSHAPAYAKVNIRMPRMNDDFSLYTGTSADGKQSGLDYATDFWFDGYYYVYGIQHSFVDGEFTQTLQMIGIPKRSSTDATMTKTQTTSDVTTIASNCVDGVIPCKGGTSKADAAPVPTNTASGKIGQPTTQAPVVAEAPPNNPTASPTNRKDARTTYAGANGVESVKGWNTASPAVRAAILDAANKYQVNPTLLAQIAAHESNMGTNNKNPKSSATGLFQVINKTWDDLVRQGKVLGVSSKSTNSRALRLDPTYNAYAGAALLKDNQKGLRMTTDIGDLYLAHFSGVDVAKRVIAADDSGNGSKPLVDIVGRSSFAEMRRRNPTVITRDNFTAGELRDWAAAQMAKTIINPTKIARAQPATREQVAKPNEPTQPTSPKPSTPTASQALGDNLDCAAASKTDVTTCNAVNTTKKEG